MFGQGKSQRHYNAAFNLPFHRQRIDCASDIMRSSDFFNSALFIQDAYLRRIAISHMGNRIWHTRAKLVCFCQIFAVILFSFQLCKRML